MVASTLQGMRNAIIKVCIDNFIAAELKKLLI
jgi:hypothetical protein